MLGSSGSIADHGTVRAAKYCTSCSYHHKCRAYVDVRIRITEEGFHLEYLTLYISIGAVRSFIINYRTSGDGRLE